jgi:hypothetical protein
MNMRNMIRSAFILGALVSTPVVAFADPTPAPSTDKAPTTDKKAPTTNKKTDAKAPSTDPKAPSTDTKTDTK